MKMGVGTRIVFSIFLLVICAVCVVIIMAAFEAFQPVDIQALVNGFTDTSYKYVWAGAAVVLFITAVCLLFFGAGRRGPTTVMLLSIDEGSVHVSIDALRELASRYLAAINTVIVSSISIRTANEEKSVRIDLRLSVKPEVSIPEVTASISGGIKEYIEKYSGINAAYVEIKILPLRTNPLPAAK